MLVVGALAGLVSLGFAGRTTGELGPGRVEVSTGLAGTGRTVVQLPPLGQISAATHRTPLRLEARVVSLDVEAVQRSAALVDPVDRLSDDVADGLPALLRSLVIRVLVVAAVAGALVGVALPGRRWWFAPVGAGGAVVAIAGLLVLTWAPYDRAAFDEATFSGALEQAPSIIAAAERNLEDLDEVQGRIDALSGRIADLYATSAADLPGGAPGETALLHVSDLHLNPLGVELVIRLARDLRVDAVLDTGDLTTFGYPVEARLATLISRVPVPYLLVPGNHDSPEIRRQLAADDDITLLDGDVVEVGGVRILGIADPTFTAGTGIDAVEARAEKWAQAPTVAIRTRRLAPDVLAVHDPEQARDVGGEVPLVVAGHLHRTTWEERDGTLLLTVGSTGATGLGSFTVETDLAYEAQVLRFVDGDLVAVDHITVAGVRGEFTIQRRLAPAALDTTTRRDGTGDARLRVG